jgi:hypothetical protein
VPPPKTPLQERQDAATFSAELWGEARDAAQKAKLDGEKEKEAINQRLIERNERNYWRDLDKNQAIREPFVMHPDGSISVGGPVGEDDKKVPR